jgi:hypothetical protein
MTEGKDSGEPTREVETYDEHDFDLDDDHDPRHAVAGQKAAAASSGARMKA